MAMTQENLNKTAKTYREGAENMKKIEEIWIVMNEKDKDRAIKELWDKGIKINTETDFYDEFIKEHYDDLDFLDELKRRIEIWEEEAEFYESSNPEDWKDEEDFDFVPKYNLY